MMLHTTMHKVSNTLEMNGQTSGTNITRLSFSNHTWECTIWRKDTNYKFKHTRKNHTQKFKIYVIGKPDLGFGLWYTWSDKPLIMLKTLSSSIVKITNIYISALWTLYHIRVNKRQKPYKFCPSGEEPLGTIISHHFKMILTLCLRK